MKFSKRIAATVIALPLMMGSMSAMAFGGKHHGGEGMHGGKGMMGKHLLRGVDLTDEQKAELKTLREQKRESMKANKGELRTQMMAERQQMQELMLADNFDEAAVRALAEKMVDQQVERRIAMVKSQHEMMSILTPEQKVQVKENMDKMAERMQKRMEDRG
ncbi:P pilus assembly/Cpx signaling pathway inhibitor/zinc-resistance associated protein [Grimontia sp. AD028]|uniref:CpxP family protein n=1 Tax=Grimontia sp. AD028 TaxID=1581149 RepID=UPI00061AF9A1|nr:CpxP family protein [Grimontia sp. AD028]KKD61475.1 P pilus assembly/Cpx signaling pathway inhibitor/zinc-resistance associated protein [Grimontia sp. AD028]